MTEHTTTQANFDRFATDGGRQVEEKLDGLDHYGVMIFVHDVDIDSGEITVATHKQNSSRHDDKVRLYREDGEWSCTMWDNYAVIDKALDILNQC